MTRDTEVKESKKIIRCSNERSMQSKLLGNPKAQNLEKGHGIALQTYVNRETLCPHFSSVKGCRFSFSNENICDSSELANREPSSF